MTYSALNLLRDNIHLAGTRGGNGGGGGAAAWWYYPPTVLDENGRLWGRFDDHLERVHENRIAVRLYYRSLQPDAPVPALLGRTGLVAAVETFAAGLLSYYEPLWSAINGVRDDLAAQTVALLAEADVLHNVVLAMRP